MPELSTPLSHYANHTLYAEEDSAAPSVKQYGVACLYSECYGTDCLGLELAEELNNRPVSAKKGDVYIGAYSTGSSYYGDHDYEVFWEYASRDPAFDERGEALAWSRAHLDAIEPKASVYLSDRTEND